ncbi:J domain-containing protein [uncultured Desulfobacter sp.]|uniref:J domain-containing protein n=1 Tax=uncultured Desulfobacter sp. TaxID=240139 RepID=UPI0029F51FF9|nr:J domain-containing protein [uncultured Desulfobacter sp.]
MNQYSTASQLFDACGVLFGPEVNVSIEFLKYLQPSGIKDAYRCQVFKAHPDRAAALGQDEESLNDRFNTLTQAYECLIAAIKGDGRVLMQQSNPRASKRSPENWNSPKTTNPKSGNDHFYSHKGAVPKRKLLIGQYLYYSGYISWNTLIEIIVRQRRDRPQIGQIALNWGLIDSDQLLYILTNRKFSEKFGDYAVRNEYFTQCNLLALLYKQKKLQRPIGHYLLKYGFGPVVLERLVRKQKHHNRNPAFK